MARTLSVNRPACCERVQPTDSYLQFSCSIGALFNSTACGSMPEASTLQDCVSLSLRLN